MNEFEKALYSEDGITPDTGISYSEYLDIDSWTKKYVMDQLFGDMDKNLYNKSIFYYKYPDSVDSHLFTGPAWDYDCSMGEGIPLATLNTPSLPVFDNRWSKELSKKEEVKSRIKEHFPMLSSQYVDNDLSNKVDELTGELSDSVLMDSIRWKSLARYTSLNKEGEYIVWYMKQRKDLLMDIWSNEEIYHTVTFLGPSKEVCGMYMIKHGDRLERVPDVFSWTDIFSGWESDEYDEVKRGIIVKNDMVIRSKWLSIETIVSNNYDDLDADLSRVDIDSLKKIKNSIQKKRNN